MFHMGKPCEHFYFSTVQIPVVPVVFITTRLMLAVRVCTLNHKLHASDVEYLIVFIVFITHNYTHIGLMWQVVLAVSRYLDIYTFLFTPVKF